MAEAGMVSASGVAPTLAVEGEATSAEAPGLGPDVDDIFRERLLLLADKREPAAGEQGASSVALPTGGQQGTEEDLEDMLRDLMTALHKEQPEDPLSPEETAAARTNAAAAKRSTEDVAPIAENSHAGTAAQPAPDLTAALSALAASAAPPPGGAAPPVIDAPPDLAAALSALAASTAAPPSGAAARAPADPFAEGGVPPGLAALLAAASKALRA